MANRHREGICHLCGVYGALSFEHVPPQSAFNSTRIKIPNIDEALRRQPHELPRGPYSQRGMGDFTLCGRCNNDTGRWYAPQFAEWCAEGMQILDRTDGRPTLFHSSYAYPLRVIKQIATMFFSVCSESFQAKNPELVRFVLNRRTTGLHYDYRFFTYYNREGNVRFSSPVAILDTRTGAATTFAEITFPPYGYVMSIASEPPDSRLCDISSFANHSYDEIASISRRLAVLQTYMPVPGDYREYRPSSKSASLKYRARPD